MGRKLTEEEKTARREARERKKAEQEAIAEKERKEWNYNNRLKDLRKSTSFSEPARYFDIGDLVTIGAYNLEVVSILDDGKIYRCEGTHTKQRRVWGGFEETVFNVGDIYAWYELEPQRTKEENDQIPRLFLQDYIHVTHSNQQIASLIHMYYRGVDLNPEYQRGHVWSLEDKVALIESIFNRVDIGMFSFIELPFNENNPDGPIYEVLDGKQRLSAIVEFCEGRFPWRGMHWHDLNNRDKCDFERTTIAVGYTAEKITRKQKLNHFLRLNTKGRVQSEEHMDKVRKMLEEEG